MIIGTLWPDRYAAYTAVPAPGAADPHAREREVLDLAAVIRIDPEFSPAEQDRARAAAARDRRLAVALEAAGYGLTQTLAAAPQLVARWEDAKTADPYAWAVLTAALDVARLGARAPLSPDLLRAAAPGYCTSQQQAEAPDNWFEQALAYATDKLHGAAAALSPAGSRHGPDRRVHRGGLPDPARQPGTPLRPRARQHLGRHPQPHPRSRRRRPARRQRQQPAAVPLRHPAVPSRRRRRRRDAARRLADLLAERGDLDELRARADAGDEDAAGQLAELLAERGDLDGLRALADAGDEHAAMRLAELLAERGDLDGAARPGRRRRRVRRLAAGRPAGRARRPGRGRQYCGPGRRRRRVRRLAAGRAAGRARGPGRGCAPGPTPATSTPPRGWPGCWPSAATWTSCAPGPTPATGMPPGGWPSCWPSAGTWDEAARPGRRRRRERRRAAGRAAGRARRPGRSCAPGPTPATRAPPCSWPTCWPSAATWTELRARADAGDRAAAVRLAELLADRGDLAELRARADAGDRAAAVRLAELLAERGDLDGLRARADAGDADADLRLAGLLADMLVKQGRTEEAERLRRFGLNPDGSIVHG